jgi:hypothetical protein
MKILKAILIPCAFALLATCALAPRLHADGIPEPGLVFYGKVENSAESNARLTTGALNWTVATGGGNALALTAPLQNLITAGGEYSYRLRIPFESIVGGNSASVNAFILNSATTSYTNSNITLSASGNNYPVSIVGPSLAVVNFNATTRGRVELINLRVNAPGLLGVGSGSLLPAVELTNNQNGGENPYSGFAFTHVMPHPEGGYYLAWTGCPSDRSYMLIRAQSIADSISEYEVVKVFPPSAALSNSYWDTNTVNAATYFYRLLAQ